MKSIQISSILLLSLLLFNCNQTDEFDQFDTLVEKEWELVSVTVNGIESIQDCEGDDRILFTEDLSFSYEEGTLTCADPSETERVSDSWKLTDEFTIIRMKYKFSGNGRGNIVEYWRINELNDSSLVLEDATAADNGLVPEFRTYRY